MKGKMFLGALVGLACATVMYLDSFEVRYCGNQLFSSPESAPKDSAQRVALLLLNDRPEDHENGKQLTLNDPTILQDMEGKEHLEKDVLSRARLLTHGQQCTLAEEQDRCPIGIYYGEANLAQEDNTSDADGQPLVAQKVFDGTHTSISKSDELLIKEQCTLTPISEQYYKRHCQLIVTKNPTTGIAGKDFCDRFCGGGSRHHGDIVAKTEVTSDTVSLTVPQARTANTHGMVVS